MNTPTKSNSVSHSSRRLRDHLFWFKLASVLCAVSLVPISGQATILSWDAGNTNNGGAIDPGSGSWNIDTTTNINWNNGSANVSWTQVNTTTPSNGAKFDGPGAAPDTYQIAVDGVQVAATNLYINASGYTFSGSPIYLLGGINNGIRMLTVSNGVSVTFSNNLTGNNANAEIALGDNGAPATMTVYGTISGWQPQFTSTNGSVFYLAGPGTSAGANVTINADVRMTNGTFNANGAFVIGRVRGASSSQPNNSTGVFTLDGPSTIFNHNSDYISIGRDGVWNSTMIMTNGATLNFQTGARNNNFEFGIPRPGSSGVNNQSRVYVKGGTLNMGPGTDPVAFPRTIKIADGGSRAGAVSILVQSAGVINAWAGIQIGGSGTYDGGTGALTNSGGFLYVGAYGGNGIRYGTSIPPTNAVSLSGGTVGALQSWISSVPMILDGNNGNITFQCADSSTVPYNIGLSGALRGPGGLNKTGGGTLNLSGANNYSGSTVVSNGILVVSSLASPTNGVVVVDGSSVAAGLPMVSNNVSAGLSWTSGNTTFAAGQPTLAFNFGGLPPSTTVAPMQVGNLAFTVTPLVTVDGTALSPGLYPLVHYAGSLSGTFPTGVTLPANVGGYISNSVAAQSLILVVTNGPTAAITWANGNGVWDIATSLNWKRFGNATNYHEADAVQFDDTSSGTSPINVTLNTVVNPTNVTVTGSKSYVISGTGSINGPVGVNVSAGTLTLSNASTYTGGTAVSAPGQLNINYGGSGGAASAVGTGPLNLNTGAKLDNTSGATLALNTATPIPINWNDDWTFVGTTNMDLGLGQVTLGNSQVILTVSSNTLTVNNQISDNGLVYQLVKAGSGTLTLSNDNSFSGGLTFNAGQLNLNSGGAAGFGTFRINGGVLDNTSGADVALTSPGALELLASFTFAGSTNLNLGAAPTTIGNNTITLNGNGALITDGAFLGGNRLTVVNGTGKWIMGGDLNNTGLGTTINGGTVYYNKNSPYFAQNTTTTVNTNGTLAMLNPTGFQLNLGAQITLGGGTVELNGDSENFTALTFNAGLLQNGAASTTSTLTVSNGITLAGANCSFGVTAADSVLSIPFALIGSGSLTKTGAGTLQLSGTNTYTGNTTISNGILALNVPSLATNSTVTVASNGVLNLNFANSETNQVAALVVVGVSKPGGVYNASTDPLFITGTGSLQVSSAVTINPAPGTIQFSAAGGSLALGWPTNAGWFLQTQTNSRSTGLSTNWATVPGSDAITNTTITINPTNGTVFFRLLKP